MQFKFELNTTVAIAVSGEAGEIIGRAEYATAENNYYVRHKNAQGAAIEAWWPESALQSS